MLHSSFRWTSQSARDNRNTNTWFCEQQRWINTPDHHCKAMLHSVIFVQSKKFVISEVSSGSPCTCRRVVFLGHSTSLMFKLSSLNLNYGRSIHLVEALSNFVRGASVRHCILVPWFWQAVNILQQLKQVFWYSDTGWGLQELKRARLILNVQVWIGMEASLRWLHYCQDERSNCVTLQVSIISNIYTFGVHPSAP